MVHQAAKGVAHRVLCIRQICSASFLRTGREPGPISIVCVEVSGLGSSLDRGVSPGRRGGGGFVGVGELGIRLRPFNASGFSSCVSEEPPGRIIMLD